jgi:hypothetical protein
MNHRSRNHDALTVMRAANPCPETELREASTEAELSLAMQRAIGGGESPSRPIPAGDRVAFEHAIRTHSARRAIFARHRGASLGLGLSGLACVAVSAALIVLSGGSVDSVRDGAHPSFAAAAVEVAEANPRLLVTAPGYSIVHARSFEVDTGELIYSDGVHRPYGPGGRQVDLTWHPSRFYRERLREDRHACCHVSTPVTSTLLGQRATTFHYPGQRPNFSTILSPQGSVFIEITGTLGNKREYEAVLQSLRAVGVDAWLRAMPPEVLRPAARSAAAEQMLRGIPVPPGFDATTRHFRVSPGPDTAALQSESALTDRFMLAKSLTGAVACGWLQRWLSATRAGDDAVAQEAVDAMATARHWPVLLQMVREKSFRGNALPPHGQGWPSEILIAAQEIASGHLRRKPAARTIYARGTPPDTSPPPKRPRRASWGASSSSCQTSDDAGLGSRRRVSGAERRDRLVGVEAAWVGNHPERRAGPADRPVDGLRLPAQSRAALAEGVAVGGDAGDRDDRGTMIGDEPLQTRAALAQLLARELGGPPGRPSYEVGDPDAPRHEMRAVGIGHPGDPIDLVLGDAGRGQRRIEAVGRMREVGFDRGRPQAGVDADKQQPESRPDEIVDLMAAEGLQLQTREPHAVILSNPRVPVRLMGGGITGRKVGSTSTTFP